MTADDSLKGQDRDIISGDIYHMMYTKNLPYFSTPMYYNQKYLLHESKRKKCQVARTPHKGLHCH